MYIHHIIPIIKYRSKPNLTDRYHHNACLGLAVPLFLKKNSLYKSVSNISTILIFQMRLMLLISTLSIKRHGLHRRIKLSGETLSVLY